MITTIYDLEHHEKEIGKRLVKELKYLAEAKDFCETDKILIKFSVAGICPYN